MNRRKKIILISVVLLIIALVSVLLCVFLIVVPNKRERDNLEKALKEYYNNKVIAFEQENLLYDDFEVDVAFIGDSLTDGYDVKKYYPQYLTVNRGIGGDTTFGLENRLQVSLYDLQPKVVVMLIGANNFDTMLDNYEDILIGYKNNLPNTKVVLLSLTAMGKDWAKNNEKASFNNNIIKKLANKYEYEFVDLFTPLLNVETQEIYEEYTTDGGHFTDAGYEILTQTITPTLEKIFSLFY